MVISHQCQAWSTSYVNRSGMLVMTHVVGVDELAPGEDEVVGLDAMARELVDGEEEHAVLHLPCHSGHKPHGVMVSSDVARRRQRPLDGRRRTCGAAPAISRCGGGGAGQSTSIAVCMTTPCREWRMRRFSPGCPTWRSAAMHSSAGARPPAAPCGSLVVVSACSNGREGAHRQA